MFDVGFQELVLLFIIGLLVLGPQRLPKVAAEIGKWVGRARRTATQLRRQLEREIELADIVNPPPPPPPPPASPPTESSAAQPPSTQPPEQNPFVAGESATPAVEPADASAAVSPVAETPSAPETTADKPPHA